MSAPSYGARLEIPGTFNLRDLGGYPADGGVVAPGLLLRAEALALPGANEVHAILDEGNREQIRGLGVRTVVDLRTDREREEAPPQWADATGARTVQLAIPEGGAGSDTHVMHELLTGGMPGFSATDMGRLYCATLDRRAGVFAEAVTLLADPANLPVLVHCSAGKDRTGLTIALVLSVLGTPRDLIVHDYALTETFRPGRVDLYAHTFADVGLTTDDVRALFETPAVAMEMGLDHLDTTYGGPVAYLLDRGGLDRHLLEKIRSNVISRARAGL